MDSHLFFSQLVLVALVWLCVMLHWTWPSDPAPVWPTTPEPLPPLRKRKREPPPVRASPPSRIAMPVSTAVPLAHRHLSPATAHRVHTGAPPPGRHRTPFLPQSGLSLLGLGRLG